MLSHFVPQEANYFSLFNTLCGHVVDGSRRLVTLIDLVAMRGIANAGEAAESDPARLGEAILALEEQAHEVAHETKRELHKSFITPIEREDILLLVSGLSKIMKLTRDAAHTVTLYGFGHIPAEICALAQQGVAGNERLQQAIALLASMDNAPRILTLCREISDIESAADREMRSGMASLFREQTDARELIKFKTLYEQLETITDYCESVAETIEGVILENS